MNARAYSKRNPESYSNDEIASLVRKALPRIKSYIWKREYSNDVRAHIWSVRDDDGLELAGGHLEYTEKVLVLVLVQEYHPKLYHYVFLDNFPNYEMTECTITLAVKARLLDGMGRILSKFPELRDQGNSSAFRRYFPLKQRNDKYVESKRHNVLSILRRVARLSERRMAREIGVDYALFKLVERSPSVLLTPEIIEAIKSALRRRGISEASLSLLGASRIGPGAAHDNLTCTYDISRSDLTTIERYLSEISSKLSSLVSGSPGYDLKALINRVETVNGHLSQIVRNTQK